MRQKKKTLKVNGKYKWGVGGGPRGVTFFFHYGMLRVINFVLNQPYYDTMLVFNFVLSPTNHYVTGKLQGVGGESENSDDEKMERELSSILFFPVF